MRPFLVLCLLTSACRAATPAAIRPPTPVVVTDSTARGAIGHAATVTGQVVQVKARTHRGFAYLNFGGRFPDHAFAVLIPDSAVAAFGDLTRFEGHAARVTGLVWLQDEKWPAMTITDPAALEFLQ